METKRITIKSVIYKGKNISVKTGEATVYTEAVRYTVDGKKQTVKKPTIIKVKPKDWDSKKQTVLPTDPEYLYKIDVIERAKHIAEFELARLKNGEDIKSPLAVLTDDSMKRLDEYIQDYIDFRKAKDTPKGTLKEFITCKNRIKSYEKHIGKRLDFQDMDFKFSDKFCIFLQEKYQQGTIHKTFSILRTILNHYYDRRDEFKIQLSDKFRAKDWKCGTPSRNEPKPLSEHQLEILKNHQFKTDALNQHKDRFLIQCFTAMRFSDAFTIHSKNIVGNFIEFYPKKTQGRKEDNLVLVPITDSLKRILDKYDNDLRKLAISNQKYNVGLGDMFDELIKDHPDDFSTRYTSHNGRDTYISIALNRGIDVPTLLKIVGQTSYDMMQRYFKADRSKMAEKLRKIQIFS